MKRLLVIFFLTICSNFLFAQSTAVDSTLAAIEKMPDDTAKVNALRAVGYEMIEEDSARSKKVLDQALNLALKVKEVDAITNTYRILGIWYSYFGDYDHSLEAYRQSLRSAESNKHQYLIAGANFNIGNIKYWKGEYDSCIQFYLKAAEVFESDDILKGEEVSKGQLDSRKSDLYGNLSAVFNTLHNLRKADEYIDKAIALTSNYKSPKAIDALAYFMQVKADNYVENGETEKGLRIRLTFLPQIEKGGIAKVYLQTAYQNIAGEYYELEKIDSAKLFAAKSLALAVKLKADGGIAGSNWQMARIAMYEKNYAEAERYMALTKEYFESTEDPLEQRNYFETMRKLKAAQGKYDEAYAYFEKSSVINDSLFKSDKAIEFSEREIRYETEKKEAQIKLQEASIKEKNILNYIFLGGAIAVLVISSLLYFNYRHKQKIQQQRINELEKEKQLSATEAVLKGEEKERTRLAKDLHDGLGGMLSGIKYSLNTMKGNLIMTPVNAQAFERSIDMLDSSIKEMRRVAHNMMPEALVKFGLDTALKDFCNDITQSGALHVNYQSIGLEKDLPEQTTSITIYRIVQELLNNAIKHAEASTAIVQVTRTDNDIAITVEDDGKGFDTSFLKTSSPGIGWTNMQHRVDFLKGKLDIQSKPGEGTSVLIEFTV